MLLAIGTPAAAEDCDQFDLVQLERKARSRCDKKAFATIRRVVDACLGQERLGDLLSWRLAACDWVREVDQADVEKGARTERPERGVGAERPQRHAQGRGGRKGPKSARTRTGGGRRRKSIARDEVARSVLRDALQQCRSVDLAGSGPDVDLALSAVGYALKKARDERVSAELRATISSQLLGGDAATPGTWAQRRSWIRH